MGEGRRPSPMGPHLATAYRSGRPKGRPLFLPARVEPVCCTRQAGRERRAVRTSVAAPARQARRTFRFRRWERPQPELSPQLVYPWGAAVVCGLWQGTPGGFSRGLAEVPLSALLPPTSWARKKSARPPGRDPAIYAAEGGSPKAPRRGAKKAFRPPGGKSKKKPRRAQRGKSPGGASVLLRLYGGLLRVLSSALTAIPAPTILKLRKMTSIQL